MAAAKKKRAAQGHPEEDLARLEQALSRGLPRVVVLRGEEHHFADRAIAMVSARAEPEGLELCRHDAGDPDFQLSTLLDDLSGGALFATGRCIVVRGAGALATKSGRQFSQAFVDAAKARMASADPGCLVLDAGGLRADSVLLKAATAADGVNVSCRRLWDSPPPWDPDPRKAELVQWLVSRARARKVKLGPDEAVYVVAATGNELSALEAQLDRIRDRGEAGLAEVVGWDAAGSPFTVAEQIVDGDARRAVPGLEGLFRSGFSKRDGGRELERGALIAMLGSTLSAKAREALAGARELGAGATPDQAWRTIGGKGGDRARQAFLGRVARRAEEDWARLATEALELERRARSGALVDQNDYAAFALRWRVREDPRGRRGGR